MHLLCTYYGYTYYQGEAHVLLSALAKPARLSGDPTEPLQAGLLLSRHDPSWADARRGVRHYQHAVHRSRAHLSSPSLAATLNLLLLRWLARDYASAFQLCGCCGSDTPLSEEEAQLWSLLSELAEDHEPGAHACRLRLWVATRCCPEILCPWSPGEQLQAYLAKMHHLPPACHLTPADELELLRRALPSYHPCSSRVTPTDGLECLYRTP